MNDRLLRIPFWTWSSGTLYSFIIAGSTVKGPHVSATIPIATVADIHSKLPRATKFPPLTAHPQLSFLNLEVVEQSSDHVMRTNGLGDVPTTSNHSHSPSNNLSSSESSYTKFQVDRSSNRGWLFRLHVLEPEQLTRKY